MERDQTLEKSSFSAEQQHLQLCSALKQVNELCNKGQLWSSFGLLLLYEPSTIWIPNENFLAKRKCLM